jgi:hypothetical protein
MATTSTEIAKKKRGFARKQGEVPATVLAQRRHRDRLRIEAMAENAAVAAAGAAAKAILTPHHDIGDEVRALIESSAQEVTRLLATSGPAIIKEAIRKATEDGDGNAIALLMRYIAPTPTTRVKVALPKDATLTDAVNSVTTQMLDGSIPLEHAQIILAALEKGGNTALSSAVLDRLSALQTRLATLSATAPPTLAKSIAYEVLDV